MQIQVAAIFIYFIILINTSSGEPNILSSADKQWPFNCSRK